MAHRESCIVLLIATAIVFAEAVTDVNKVAFETRDFFVKCSSKVPPMWSWVGKNTNEIKSMAFGDNKQIRFTDSR